MNRQPFERMLRAFVSDVPDAAPRDLLESVLTQLPSVNQRRRRFGVVGRVPDMLTPLRSIAAIAAVLVIAVAGYALLAKGPSSGGLTPTPSPTVAPSPTTAAVNPGPSPRIAGATVVTEGTNLVAGVTYVMRNFEPAFTFTGVDGVRFDTDAPTFAWLEHTASTRPLLAVVAVGSVFDEAGAAIAVPSDLVTWLQARSDFAVTKTSTIQLGSVSGTLIEGTLDLTAHANAAHHVNLFCPQTAGCDFEGGGSSGLDPGQRFEIIVVTVNGKLIVVSGGATPAEWGTVGVDFDAFMRSINFPA